MFDRVNIKAVVIVTSLAAIVSISAGGIGGVSMGTLLLRALASAILFGVGAVVVNILVDMFLPELLFPQSQEKTDEESGADSSERGQNIDIVMDDQPAAMTVASSLEDGSGVNRSPEEVLSPSSSQEYREGQDFTPTSVSGNSNHQGDVLPDIGVFTESMEDGDDEDQVDDIDSSDATGSDESASVTSRFSSMQANNDDQIDFFQNNSNAEDMAKGVRTMLKRDEKG